MAPSRMRLADQITDAILGGKLPAGTRLDEAGLAALLGLPPALVRKALAEVCARGLAERRPGQGFEVVTPDLAVLLDWFEALSEIQALCAGLAARRAAPADLLALEDLVTRMEDADFPAYRQMTVDLQDRICRMARNAELARMAADLRRRLAAVSRGLPDHADRRRWQLTNTAPLSRRSPTTTRRLPPPSCAATCAPPRARFCSWRAAPVSRPAAARHRRGTGGPPIPASISRSRPARSAAGRRDRRDGGADRRPHGHGSR